MVNQGSPYVIRNWQGTGQDYQLFVAQQRGSAIMPHSTVNSTSHRYLARVAGLTMRQMWNQYGIGYLGDVVNDADIVPLEGVSNGFARLGATTTLGVPRTVLTSPSTTWNYPAGLASIKLYLLLTGDHTQASDRAVFTVDGGPVVRRGRVLGDPVPYGRSYVTTATSLGTHTIVTWRETPAGVRIPASELTFTYTVGP